MPHNNKQEECHCKEMTCPKDCARNHTHKGFFCEKCEPDVYKKMYSQPPKQGEECHCERTSMFKRRDGIYKNHSVKQCWNDPEPEKSEEQEVFILIQKGVLNQYQFKLWLKALLQKDREDVKKELSEKVEKLKTDYKKEALMEFSGKAINDETLKEIVKISCEGRQNATVDAVLEIIRKG